MYASYGRHIPCQLCRFFSAYVMPYCLYRPASRGDKMPAPAGKTLREWPYWFNPCRDIRKKSKYPCGRKKSWCSGVRASRSLRHDGGMCCTSAISLYAICSTHRPQRHGHDISQEPLSRSSIHYTGHGPAPRIARRTATGVSSFLLALT